MPEYMKAIMARINKANAMLIAAEQGKHLTFTPSDFHNLPCKPMRVKG